MFHDIESALAQALEQCAAEPIHQLGTIQSHGVALVLTPTAELTIIQASENLADLLEISADLALGQPLAGVLGKTATQQVVQLIELAVNAKVNRTTGIIDITTDCCHKLDAHLYLSAGYPVLELSDDYCLAVSENWADLILKTQTLLVDEVDVEQDRGNLTQQQHQYFEKVAQTVRAITGYDNVMVYEFDENWDGQVIAQCRIATATDYLGTYFPASDIPAQARKLYTQNLVRVVTDVDAIAVPMVPAINPLTNAPLDMSLASLRSLSPIHIAYLRNMGITATMTISLLQNGKLWGLIACHHHTPKRVSVAMREAAHFISQLISSKLVMFELLNQHSLSNKVLELNIQRIAKLESVSSHDVKNTLPELMSLFNATGIIVVVDNQCFHEGITPPQGDLDDLLAWLDPQIIDEPFVCNQLSGIYVQAKAYAENVAGLLAIRHATTMKNCVIWLRQERIRNINWAGSYAQGLTQSADDKYVMSPRQSFDVWSETWRGFCEPWAQEEIKFAELIRKSLSNFLHSLHLEYKLLDNQYQQDELVNFIPNSIVMTNPQRLITFVNKDFERITGYSKREVMGKPCSILQGPDTDPEQLQHIRDSLDAGLPFLGELLNYRKDGSTFWNELHISPIFNSQNQLSQYVGIQRDITDQKLRQVALVSSEKRFRELSDVAPALIWQADNYKNRFWFNKGWFDFTGRSFEAEQGDGWMQGIHPDDYQVFIKTYYEAFDRRDAFRIEYRLRRADGEYRWIDGQGVPQFNEVGDFEGYVGTCTDVTDVRNSKAATDFFNVAHEMIYSTDLQGFIIDCNQHFCDVTGFARDEVIGRSVRILKSGLHDKFFYTRIWEDVNSVGFWRGEITNRKKSGTFFTVITTISTIHDTQGKPNRYLAVASDISTFIEKRQYLEQLAYYDNLTGLPNRSLIIDRLTSAMKQIKHDGGLIALLFIDLDGFKAINDHYGHDVGDEFLAAMGQQMRATMRQSDILARYGGDEFVVLLDGLNNHQDLGGIVTALLRSCSDNIVIRGMSLKISASVGVRLYPLDTETNDIDALGLLNQADQAMYVAKRQGKNTYHVFDQEQDQIIITRNNGVEAIQIGIALDEFELYYQPKVNMRSGEVIGFEGLIRWHKNKSELLEPAKFLSLIENNPLGIDIGVWVIKTAIKQLEQWREQGLQTTVSVNIDARQLMQANFVELLSAELQHHPHYQRHSLVLEILETIAIDDRVNVIKVIHQCKALGVDFALDDFGTGYSSITYLKELPIKTVKIDRSFIVGITQSQQNFKLVAHITHLANDMGKQVIAEGVETIEQGELLLNMGCDLGQGYVIAKPMPASKVLTWFNNWQVYPSWLNAITSDRNYHLLFERMIDPMVIIKNARFIECNLAAVRFLGYPYKERLLNQRPSDISPIRQPDGSLSTEKSRAIMDAAKQSGFQCFEWVYIRADGSEVLVEVVLTMMNLNGEDVMQSVWSEVNTVFVH